MKTNRTQTDCEAQTNKDWLLFQATFSRNIVAWDSESRTLGIKQVLQVRRAHKSLWADPRSADAQRLSHINTYANKNITTRLNQEVPIHSSSFLCHKNGEKLLLYAAVFYTTEDILEAHPSISKKNLIQSLKWSLVRSIKVVRAGLQKTGWDGIKRLQVTSGWKLVMLVRLPVLNQNNQTAIEHTSRHRMVCHTQDLPAPKTCNEITRCLFCLESTSSLWSGTDTGWPMSYRPWDLDTFDTRLARWTGYVSCIIHNFWQKLYASL